MSRPQKWQRNSLFEAVVAGGLDPTECTFDYDDEGGRITHVPSGSYALLEGDASEYGLTLVEGESGESPVSYYTWSSVPDRVKRWAADVKRDVDTPDLWAELQRDRELLTGVGHEEVANTPFSESEQREIAKQLHEITDYIKNKHELSDPEKQALDETRDYLENAARHLGRIDWRNAVVGALLGTVFAAVLPQEPVRDMLVMLFRSVAHLFGHPFPELPSG